MRKDGPLFYRILYRSLLDALQEVWFSNFRVQDHIQVLVGVGLTLPNRVGEKPIQI
jgi:hypothetical protein